jgi:hypothetical protein
MTLDDKKRRLLQRAGLVLLVAAVAAGGYFASRPLGAEKLFFTPTPAATPSATPNSLRVKVLGEVAAPGEYIMVKGSTLLDVINQAGGLTADADVTTSRLLQPAEDGMVLLIPRKTGK